MSETEQKRYYDVKTDVDKESTSETKKSYERKTKVFGYIAIGVVIVLCFMFLVNRIVNKKSN